MGKPYRKPDENTSFDELSDMVAERMEDYRSSPALTSAEGRAVDSVAEEIRNSSSWRTAWLPVQKLAGACSFVLNYTPIAAPNNITNVALGSKPAAKPGKGKINRHFQLHHLRRQGLTEDRSPYLDVQQSTGDSFSLLDIYHDDNKAKVADSDNHKELMQPYGLTDWFGTRIYGNQDAILVMVPFFEHWLDEDPRKKLYHVMRRLSGPLAEAAVRLGTFGPGSLDEILSSDGRLERGTVVWDRRSMPVMSHEAVALFDTYRKPLGNTDLHALCRTMLTRMQADYSAYLDSGAEVTVPKELSYWDEGLEIRVRWVESERKTLLCLLGGAHEPTKLQLEKLRSRRLSAKWPKVYSGNVAWRISSTDGQKTTLGRKIERHLVLDGNLAVIHNGIDPLGILEPVTRESLARAWGDGVLRQEDVVSLTEFKENFGFYMKKVRETGRSYLLAGHQAVVAVLSPFGSLAFKRDN